MIKYIPNSVLKLFYFEESLNLMRDLLSRDKNNSSILIISTQKFIEMMAV